MWSSNNRIYTLMAVPVIFPTLFTQLLDMEGLVITEVAATHIRDRTDSK